MVHDLVLFSSALTLGLVVGFYVSHRGVHGVVSDLNDVKTDVAVLKSKVDGQAQTPAV